MHRLLLTLLFTSQAFANVPCPHHLMYQGAGLLKNGDTFYYRTGGILLERGRIFYPTGGQMKSGDRWFFPNGATFRNGDRLYYSNGMPLKVNDHYYYANGGFFKRGETFFYSNGSLARHNGQLYKPDGSFTDFPLRLSSRVGNMGTLFAEVQTDVEQLQLEIFGSWLQAGEVNAWVGFDGEQWSPFEFEIRTGAPGEAILVQLRDGKTSCRLIPTGLNPNRRVIHSRQGVRAP